MPVESKTPKAAWSHLLIAAGGIAAGAMFAHNEVAEAKKSRAEHDDPEGVEQVRAEIGELLDDWEPDPACVTEDDFTRDLVEWLDENSEWEVQLYPSTREGKPDIVVGDLLALELKLAPTKGELDRCIGQCAAYSRQWTTWMVLIDAPATETGRLEDLLADKGLEQIAVWRFD